MKNIMSDDIMFKKGIKVLFASLLLGFSVNSVRALTIVLDPGHGDTALGCCRTYDGKKITERDLNLKIANFVKSALEKTI